LKISLLNACTVVIFFMPVSFSLRHERVDPWERIASRWRPVFSSHLVNAVTGKVGASTRSGFSDVLLNHKSGAFVLAQPDKLRPWRYRYFLHLRSEISLTVNNTLGIMHGWGF